MLCACPGVCAYALVGELEVLEAHTQTAEPTLRLQLVQMVWMMVDANMSRLQGQTEELTMNASDHVDDHVARQN
jgi:serine protease inhibitor ecotin